MSRAKFLMLLFMLNLGFVFIKIYQHNQLIGLNYERQRIENYISHLKKREADLQVQLFELKKQERVKKIAQEKLGMRPLKLSQVITIT